MFANFIDLKAFFLDSGPPEAYVMVRTFSDQGSCIQTRRGRSTLEKQKTASKHHVMKIAIFAKLFKYEPGGGKSTPQIPNFKVSCSDSLKNAIFTAKTVRGDVLVRNTT